MPADFFTTMITVTMTAPSRKPKIMERTVSAVQASAPLEMDSVRW